MTSRSENEKKSLLHPIFTLHEYWLWSANYVVAEITLCNLLFFQRFLCYSQEDA